MARSKARVYTCCALMLLLVVAIIVCIAVLVRRKCSADTFSNAAVAADSKRCSEIARDILLRGGSAVDGAIAALLCTSVMNPQSMGIGGGSIFTVMDSSGSQWIGIPGEIRGYEKAHKLYGKLPWATLFQPTIQMAREGFPLPQVQAQYIPYIDTNETQALRKLYSDKNGNLLKMGDTVKFEKLADTLEMIANHGADAFYTGKIAENLIRDLQEEGYDWNSASLTGEQKTLAYHRYVEAFKFANVLKKHIRDPVFGSEEKARKFTDDSFANHIRSLISSNKAHDPQYYNITPYLDNMGTTHVSVLAEDGSAVSVTSTINHIFGSKVFSQSTGIILNNELSDFCGRVENIYPGEQPPSSMSPALLKSQSKMLVIGSTGGSMITTGIASALMNHLWFGKSLKDAIAAPVVFVDAQNALKFEPKFDKNVIEALKALGHKEETATYFYNVVNAVEKEDGCICAVSDARKQGEAAGY
ncbi:Glutathione hydrolase 5 proenzyme [Channa argus]|uniref:Glutathione hydrolase 5 proenzyme n=1 Tax=Channa argus TaxID=215402 RepID=A0A6G1Q0S8_CHAAH|nr:Glutathione hydrolase 5 proenzyme [Channa argus]